MVKRYKTLIYNNVMYEKYYNILVKRVVLCNITIKYTDNHVNYHNVTGEGDTQFRHNSINIQIGGCFEIELN